MSKLGIFMGSFDPPHIGHLSVITEVVNSKLVDEVHIVPAWKNVWKSTKTSFRDRCDMCIDSIKPYPKVYVNKIEELIVETYPEYTTKGIPSYVTMSEFVKLNKFNYSNIYFITTKETYAEIPLWENGEDILKTYKFIVCGYNGDVSIPRIDISSTIIREMIKDRKQVYPYVGYDVLKYIKEKGLYV